MTDPTCTTVRIPFADGTFTTVDRADMELLSGFNWKKVNGYVMAQRGLMYIYMHRLLGGAGPDQHVDHINRDPLDNRSSNLRVATPSQNHGNRGPDRRRLGTTSRHKGVCLNRRRGKWCAYIHYMGKTRGLGRYDDEDDAARAYNRAALETWGEFARLNDVD